VDFDVERFSYFTADWIRDASSLGCYAVSTGKVLGAEFRLRFVDNYLPDLMCDIPIVCVTN
jgi:hypothetical protein